ncbi:hypothetical protein EKO27_g6889 [Xylaria grammica]|uniref:Uncharacterized protein n=1 Tax=Xylaria grammica TaxID=363999 RepID=A0A439D193_9PEZI|nr:hypothetical protein EKO27_g6889 [Xylaria grammica]
MEGIGCSLFVPSSGRTYDIVSKTSSTGNGRFKEEEYSSTIYPIDGLDIIYNGNVALPDRPSLSAKVSFPALVGEPSGSNLHQKGYELVLHHLYMLKDDNVRKRARRGIEALLHVISCDVDRQCSKIPSKVVVKAIALSIPAHWTLEFEDLYREMVRKAFSKYQGDIFFLTEAEALAHYLYREHRPVLVPDSYDDAGARVLIMDFGGHNNIAAGSDEDPGFYHLTKPGDAGGGSEQWEHYIAEDCIRILANEGYIDSDEDATPQQRQKILDDFNRFKRNHCEDTDADFEFQYLAPKGRTEKLVLEAVRITAAHEKAFDSALQKANSMIKEAAALSNKTARIIVTGGSVKSKLTKDRLEQRCQKHEMSDGLEFIGEQGISELNMRIAHGAAYAIAYQLSVRDFIDRGAAFGMQLRSIGPRTPHPDAQLWDSEATLLFFKGSASAFGRAVSVQGRWSFRVDITEGEGGMVFKLEGYGEDYVRSDRVLIKKTWLFPMYMNIGANAAHLGNADEPPETIFAELWGDLGSLRKGPTHAPTNKRSRVSSKKPPAVPEVSQAHPTPKEPPQPSPTPGLSSPTQEAAVHSTEAGMSLEGDAGSEGTTATGTLDEFNGVSFTSINRERNLRDVGAQSLGLIEMFSASDATGLGYDTGKSKESRTWWDDEGGNYF